MRKWKELMLFLLTGGICHFLEELLWGVRVIVMAANSGLLKDSIVPQSFGPMNEALHFRITHVRLTFVVTCYNRTAEVFSNHISAGHFWLQLFQPVMNVSVSKLLVRYVSEPSTLQTLIWVQTR